jgi:saccharopine dehydrogenase-like NADP-dependent oxidoreductase
MKNATVLVLGAGEIGSIIARILSLDPKVSEIVLADINEQRAREVSKWIGSEKIVPRYLDIRDHASLVNAMKDADVFVHSAFYTLSVHVTKASIDAGVNGLDLGGLYYYTLKQLELNELAEKAGITYIVGLGSAPGLTNIMAKYAADKMDKVDEIHMRIATYLPIEKEKSKPLMFFYSPRTYIDQFSLDAVIYRDGKYETVPAGSGREVVFFPEPFNFEAEAYYGLHSELATLPRTIKGVRVVDMKLAYSPELVKAMKLFKEIGLASEEPIRVEGVSIAPINVLLALLYRFVERRGDTMELVIVNGEKGGEKVTYKVWVVGYYHETWNVSGDAYHTAVPAPLGVKMLMEGRIKVKGVIPPELAIEEPSQFFKELVELARRTHGRIEFYESITTTRKMF